MSPPSQVRAALRGRVHPQNRCCPRPPRSALLSEVGSTPLGGSETPFQTCLLYRKGCEKDDDLSLRFQYYDMKTCEAAYGCADLTADAYFSPGVVGCDMILPESTPGVFNAAGACNQQKEWGVCPSAAHAKALGLSRESCDNAAPRGTFYASLQSSVLGALDGSCEKPEAGQVERGANDVWGCGKDRV